MAQLLPYLTAPGVEHHDGLAPLVILGSGAKSVFKEGGTAVVIHAGADDYHTDPSGAAGARIACGVITEVTT